MIRRIILFNSKVVTILIRVCSKIVRSSRKVSIIVIVFVILRLTNGLSKYKADI